MKAKEKTKVFLCDEIVRRYNSTAAMIFGHIAFHIVKNNKFDASPKAVTTFCGISIATVKKYIKLFVEDKLLTKTESKFHFRSALEFNLESNDLTNHLVFEAYHCTFNNAVKSKTNDLYVVECTITQLKNNWLPSKQAEHQRTLLFVLSFIRDRLASQRVNQAKEVFYARYYTNLAKQFGLAVNTVKKVIKALQKEQSIKTDRVEGQLIISGLMKLSRNIELKAKAIKKIISAPPKSLYFAKIKKQLRSQTE